MKDTWDITWECEMIPAASHLRPLSHRHSKENKAGGGHQEKQAEPSACGSCYTNNCSQGFSNISCLPATALSAYPRPWFPHPTSWEQPAMTIDLCIQCRLCLSGFAQSSESGTLNSLMLQIRKLRLREVKWVASGHTAVRSQKQTFQAPALVYVDCIHIYNQPHGSVPRFRHPSLHPSSSMMAEETGSTSCSGGIISISPNKRLKFMALAVIEGIAHDHE